MKADPKAFELAYDKLNPAQKEAVEATEGPVMVVAGPGTGKTQVLALRIANILKKTDIGADGILCLTFTNSGANAMRSRLESYIGKMAGDVRISTFHAFAIDLVEKNYELLDFEKIPKLLTDEEAVFLVDEILHNNEWEYIRPRTNPAMYFGEIKQLISILKREGMSPKEFLFEVEHDIKSLESDPESISTRGESKGKIKKEVETKIKSLQRTREVVEFYRIYEEKKKENVLMDYDDVLSYAVQLATDFDDVRADIYEAYQYVLVDEHQDSSGIQNNFLKAVWQDQEKPNIFVVGDDRQLIYGFSGAKLSYFEEFANYFGKAKKIVLTENYRSTAPILSLADELLQSTITKDKLNSNTKGNDLVSLRQYNYLRDEILGAGLYFKQKINPPDGGAKGILPEDMALLVPKNYHVREAMTILKNMGLPVSSGSSMSLWSAYQSESLQRVLNTIVDPYNSVLLCESLLDASSGIPTLQAHKFLKSIKPDKLTIDELVSFGKGGNLFDGENEISKWGQMLKKWVNELSHEKTSLIVSNIGNELLINKSENHDELLRNVEVVRSFIHLAMQYEEKNPTGRLKEFLDYLTRLQSYGSHIELATFGSNSGVQVMTLHKSKGLEYKYVWIAHMNEEVLMPEKKNGFTLPEVVKAHMHEKDILSARRELYVAITRAKEYCTISYAKGNNTGGDMNLAKIIEQIPDIHFSKKSSIETENELLQYGPQIYTEIVKAEKINIIDELKQFTKERFSESKVSVTLLNNFFECPWKWYFRNFLKLPEIKGVSLALGSAVHSTIEYILKENPPAGGVPSVVDIKAKIKNELLKEGVPESGAELKKLFDDAYRAVKKWIDHYYKNLAKDYISERSVQFCDSQFPDLTMYGKLDLTERFAGGDMVITDFKTGKVKTRNEIEKEENGRLSGYMRQLAMYSYLIAGAEKGKNVTESRLLFLEAEQDDKNTLYSTHISEEQIDLLKKDIGDYVNTISSGEWVNNECHYKPWGSSRDSCPYCERAKIYK